MDIQLFFENYEKTFGQESQESPEAFLRKSLEQAEAEQDEGALITILNEAAGYFRNLGRRQESVAAADRALGLITKLGLEDGVPHGTTLLNAATAYKAAGMADRALELFSASLAVLRKHLPETDHRLAALYNNISSIHEEQGRFPEALEALEQAARIMEIDARAPENTAVVLTNLGMLLLRMDRREEALSRLERAETLFREGAAGRGTPDELAPPYAATAAGMAEIRYRSGDFAGAVQCYETALAHLGSTFGKNMDYVITCRNCAEALEASGDADRALSMRAEADAAEAALNRA